MTLLARLQCTLCYLLIAFNSSSGNLLEMSQTLWTKFLNGGLSNIGSLDPLRIPLVKVDQSHGDTTYRMILSNVEIAGLNASTLESIHIVRGSVKSNLTEHEAGFVSYNDRNIIDSIRYRFHTADEESLVRVRNTENLEVESIEHQSAANDRSQNQDVSSRRTSYTNRNNDGNEQSARSQLRQQPQRERYQAQDNSALQKQFNNNNNNNNKNNNNERNNQQNFDQYNRQIIRNRQYNNNYQEQNVRSGNPYSTTPLSNRNQKLNGPNLQVIYAQRQPNNDNERRFRNNEQLMRNQNASNKPVSSSVNYQNQRNLNGRLNQPRYYSTSKPCAPHQQHSARLEEQPGYVDIVYADDKNKKMRHFGNLKIEERNNTTTYSLEDLLKDLESHKRLIIRNYTEGELLLKNYNSARIAAETKRIDDLIRYAKNFQEKNGYYEEGMEILYHYGNENNSKLFDGKRTKRAHKDDSDSEDDIIHIITKIHVPLLKIQGAYSLMGKVGEQVLRGNGQFKGDFAELTGHFTVELKKDGDTSLIVRSTRAKLEAKQQNVILQGMDENGPVKEILTQGLMAAEAVAAMLVDDLTTKVLTDTTSDAMIYKMYKELPNK